MEWILLLSALAQAQASEPEDPDGTLVVHEDRPAPSGSSRTLTQEELAALPGRSADELLRAMPGLHMSAHGGRGKAYQYFLRGFDAVHGGDVAVDVEGVPLNELSNPHAHGYLDLNLMPTVLLRRLELTPGPTRPEVGDFAVAGSASFMLGLEQEGGQVQLGLGSDLSAQTSLSYRPRGRSAGNFAVAESNLGQGVGESRAWRQARLAAGVEGPQARAWVLGYAADFESAGVLRLDEVDSAEVDFYGSYPGSGGGRSARVLAGASAWGARGDAVWQGQLYGGLRQLALEQNFTGWYSDPVNGDGSLQESQSLSAGARLRGAWTPGPQWLVQGGLDLRSEQVSRQSSGVTPQGVVWQAGELQEGLHLQSAAWLSSSWRRGALNIEPALRAELLGIQRDGYRARAPVLAPKLAASLGQGQLRGHASYGRGFRSTDLAGVDRDGRLPLTQVDAAEVGVRGELTPTLELRAALFGSLVSKEVVFDHVQARYLAGGASERMGLDSGLVWCMHPDLELQLDLSLSSARYRATKYPVPYAPRLLLSTTLQSLSWQLGPGALSGSLRAWFLGARPLPGGFVSQPSSMVDLKLRYQLQVWAVGAEVDNLLGQEQRDGEFVYASHWDLDSPRSELPVRHITAGAPTALRLSLYRSF